VTAFRTILCPTDFSELSGEAFHLAAALARDHGARLVVLHVAAPPPGVNYAEMEKALARPDGCRRELEDRLRGYAAPAGVAVEHRLAEGEPAAEVLRAAEDVGCDLIVMGTHGRTWLRRALMGSIAEQVVRRAPCPVLTISGPARRDQPGGPP